jgi:hypothetical protein
MAIQSDSHSDPGRSQNRKARVARCMGWKESIVSMQYRPHAFQLHYEPGGKLVLETGEHRGAIGFTCLKEAVTYARYASACGHPRLTVYDVHGRQVIETLV